MISLPVGLAMLLGTVLFLLVGCTPVSSPSSDTTTPRPPAQIIIEDAYPDKATYHPGQDALIIVRLRNDGAANYSGSVIARLLWLTDEITETHTPLTLARGETCDLRLKMDVPGTDFRGYGVDIEVTDEAGHSVACTTTALDVLSDWPLAPRYGFFADFSANEPDTVERVAQLGKYHINVVQYYDWMYRHYQLLPPGGQTEFVDALGRKLSLETVRRKIELGHERNMTALAYGAVYGAEPEFVDKHRDLALYKADGTPESIENLFYTMDIRRGSPWHDLIINEYVKAVTDMPFDGIHMDQYGFPKSAFVGSADGPAVFLDEHFGPLIDDSARAVQEAKSSAKVIFNCVNDWPTEKVAASDQAAIYIEVWSPHDSYSDLRRLILKAKKAASGQKQIILAAYMSPLLNAKPEMLESAEVATRLTTATIFANGGFHLLMGEGDGALDDPYYPQYATLRPEFANVMRRYYDFFVRYENWLVDPVLEDISEDALGTRSGDPRPTGSGDPRPTGSGDPRPTGSGDPRPTGGTRSGDSRPTGGTRSGDSRPTEGTRSGDPCPTGSGDLRPTEGLVSLAVENYGHRGRKGEVWTLVHEGPDLLTINLVNLTGLANDYWNLLHQPPTTLEEFSVELDLAAEAVYFASPDFDGGRAIRLETNVTAGRTQFVVPRLEYWNLIIVQLAR